MAIAGWNGLVLYCSGFWAIAMLKGPGVADQSSFRPPAPVPLARSLGPIALISALWRNPLEAWTQAHFEQPVVVTNLAIGEIAVVSEPQAVRRLLLENATNYRKDNFQRRMMSATLGDGLLMAEGGGWGEPRRLFCP